VGPLVGKLGGCVCTYLIICFSCAHRSWLTALRVFFCVSGTLLHMSKYTRLRTYPHRYISYYLVKVQSHRHVRSFSCGIIYFFFALSSRRTVLYLLKVQYTFIEYIRVCFYSWKFTGVLVAVLISLKLYFCTFCTCQRILFNSLN